MYRSTMKKEEIPIVLQHPVEEFRETSDASYSQATPQRFFERVTNLPLVRNITSQVQSIYENTKERNGLLRTALELGEKNVLYSYNVAAEIMCRTGLTDRLQKPLELADSTACYVLDKVEGKVPLITKSPYEIKLMVNQKVDAKFEKLQNARENTVEKVRTYRRWSSQTMTECKEITAGRVNKVLETPYGQTFSHVIEYGLSKVDSAVDKFLPEGHSHKNGSVSNGHATNGNGNGYQSGYFEQAKQISHKIHRRLSAKTYDVVDHAVDNIIQTPGAVAFHNTVTYVRETSNGVVNSQIYRAKRVASFTAGKAYVTVADAVGKCVDLFHWSLMMVLPSAYHEQVNVLLDRGVHKLAKVLDKEEVLEE